MEWFGEMIDLLFFFFVSVQNNVRKDSELKVPIKRKKNLVKLNFGKIKYIECLENNYTNSFTDNQILVN